MNRTALLSTRREVCPKETVHPSPKQKWQHSFSIVVKKSMYGTPPFLEDVLEETLVPQPLVIVGHLPSMDP